MLISDIQVATTCPLLWDVLGFPGSFPYEPSPIYFNRTDVQKAIHAPIQEWEECTEVDVFVNSDDTSAPSALSVLPGVIEKADRVIIGHGILDMILIYNGTLVAIQNMTFNGAQGFSKGPDQFEDFYVPYHTEFDNQLGSIAASGVMGQFHTERGLTLVTIQQSGHMVCFFSPSIGSICYTRHLCHSDTDRSMQVPQYAPSAAYRQLEFLLGRIPSLGTVGPFTTMQGTSY
jgi:carboxypeptidase D